MTADTEVSQFCASTATTNSNEFHHQHDNEGDVTNLADSERDAKLRTFADCCAADATVASYKNQKRPQLLRATTTTTTNNNNSNNNQVTKGQSGDRRFKSSDERKPAMLALKLKHQANYPQRDIESIRNMIRLDWQQQSPEECELWADEFERMMQDDWLVTRFLIRGFKMAACQKSASLLAKTIVVDVDSNNNECEPTKIDDTNGASTNNKLESGYQETMRLIQDCHKFRSKFQVSNCRGLDEFPQAWTRLEGILSYGCDLVGNSVLYLRCKLHRPKLIEQAHLRHQFKRMLLYHLNRCDLALENRPGKAICCVFDMSDATLDNFDRELISWMLSSFKTCSPKLLSYIMIYNLPWFLSATFKLITNNLLSRANKHSLRFVYGKEILSYISEDHLPDYISWRLADSS